MSTLRDEIENMVNYLATTDKNQTGRVSEETKQIAKIQKVKLSDKRMVTIYTSSDMFGSIIKAEGELLDYGVKQYAQYDAAPFARFIPKGKRKPTGFVKGFQPYVLILEGLGHPTPAGMFDAPVVQGDVIIKQSTYTSFDEGYKTDFDKKMSEYIKEHVVVMDIRNTVNTNFIAPKK